MSTPINLVLKDEDDSSVKEDLRQDLEYKSKSEDIKDEYRNKQLELIWKKFLDENPSISSKLYDVPENVAMAGSILLSNGMYDEAVKWKEYRRAELRKINLDD